MGKRNILSPRTLLASLFIIQLALSGNVLAQPNNNNPGPSPAASPITNGVLTLRSSTYEAGAISSLVWNGKQFINRYDHGRQLQVAYQLNGQGECNNPTEAGSNWDGRNLYTSSFLESYLVSGSVMQSRSRPAFWLRPGESNGYCVAQNSSVRSNDTIFKQVTVGMPPEPVFGYPGDPKVVRFECVITLAQAVTHLVVFSPVGFLNQEFSNFYVYNPISDGLSQINVPPDTWPPLSPLPMILSTPNGQFAMGFYAPWPQGVSTNPAIGSTHAYNYYSHFNYANPPQGTQVCGPIFTLGPKDSSGNPTTGVLQLQVMRN